MSSLYSLPQNIQDDYHDLLTPENFAMVESGVYRSAFPRSKNILFLSSLNLKSVVALIPEDYPAHMVEFYKKNDIKLIKFGLDGNKWPFKQIDEFDFRSVLREIMNPLNRPLLIHCNKGKHRTGTVVGCIRKIREWSFSSIVGEYLMFAAPKTRLEDQRYIESFDVEDFNQYCLILSVIEKSELKTSSSEGDNLEQSSSSSVSIIVKN